MLSPQCGLHSRYESNGRRIPTNKEETKKEEGIDPFLVLFIRLTFIHWFGNNTAEMGMRDWKTKGLPERGANIYIRVKPFLATKQPSWK